MYIELGQIQAHSNRFMNVIIIEDDKVLFLLLTKMIERLDHTVIATAARGVDAIGHGKSLKADLILMDIMLEDEIDGIQVMSELRKLNITTPVIYITGNSDLSSKNRALSTNFVDYLIKPISIDDLRESIRKIEL